MRKFHEYKVTAIIPHEYSVWARNKTEARTLVEQKLLNVNPPIPHSIAGEPKVTFINRRFARSMYDKLRVIVRIILVEKLR